MANLGGVIDSALRGRGAADGCCGVLLLEDTAEFCGGQFVWRQVVSELFTSFSKHRARAERIRVIPVDWPEKEYVNIQQSTRDAPPIEFHDCSSDPLGWLRQDEGDAPDNKPGSVTPEETDTAGGALKKLESVLKQGSSQSVAILDSLTTLLLRFSFAEVLSLVEFLRRSHACVILRIYKDVHLPRITQAFEWMSSAFIEMGCPTDLQRDIAESVMGKPPHGSIDIKQKTQAGRVSVTSYWFTLNNGCGVDFFSPPVDMKVNAQQAAVAKVKADADKKGEDVPLEKSLMDDMEGGMKLTLTEQERQAKASVVLPYEKTGKDGDDENSGQKLGEIVYYRDSENDYDSDEDPDDDLDI
ncbi:hypothetical protein BSKO_00331 [Bryopsis sp. KO-2023]|nr:hypothetical protein BSKO_00331 [Bryopsis sp. KO-2023]